MRYINLLFIIGVTLPSVSLAKEWYVDASSSDRFNPHDIEIEPGDSIIWTNDSHIIHEVRFINTPDNFKNQPRRYMLKRRGKLRLTLTEKGVYDYTCLWHGMHGSILVKDPDEK